jgi:hypothetical protein
MGGTSLKMAGRFRQAKSLEGVRNAEKAGARAWEARAAAYRD